MGIVKKLSDNSPKISVFGRLINNNMAYKDLTLPTIKGSKLTIQEGEDNFTTLRDEIALINGDLITLEAGTYNFGTEINNKVGILLLDNTGGAINVYLPDATTSFNKHIILKRLANSQNSTTVYPINSQTIDGEASHIVNQEWHMMIMISDGTQWLIISHG